jgi:predicted metalloprotease with PDZ domain
MTSMAFTLVHTLAIADARAHLVSVETTVRSDAPLAAPLVLFMPVWTPGSYLVREYARHLEGVHAFADGRPCTVVKIRKNAWRVGGVGARELSFRYRVYCNELTVRTNHVDESHALLNGAAVFVAIDGHEGTAATVDVALPAGWEIRTALPRAQGEVDGGRVRLSARDLDALVDAPIELGELRTERVLVKRVPHELVLWPKDRADDAQVASLLRDFGTIVETESAWFGGTLPYERYTALLHLSPRARGGLEHMSSAALIASPNAFATRDGYLDLLSLFAHELFHAWNVKRIRPAGIFPYRYQEENYTRLLWWFEGATSYYDWRTLRVAGLCTEVEYLEHLAAEIAAMDRVHGRLVQPLELASFDAWIKLYRPDENSDNSSVSYYRKGEIVCALLDVEIRARTQGRASLDTVLRHLWERHGKVGEPVPEDGMQALFEEATGAPLGDLFDAWIRSAGEIDYDLSLAKVGMRIDREPREEKDGADKKSRAALGVRVRTDGGRAIVATVTRGGAAQLGGIDPGDELLAIAGRRIEGGAIDAALVSRAPHEEVEVTVARDGRLLTLRVRLEEMRPDKIRIVPLVDVKRASATDAERALGVSWLASAT